jgi:hypothetical protein
MHTRDSTEDEIAINEELLSSHGGYEMDLLQLEFIRQYLNGQLNKTQDHKFRDMAKQIEMVQLEALNDDYTAWHYLVMKGQAAYERSGYGG